MPFIRSLLLSLCLAVVAFSAAAGPIDINTASAEELAASIQGVGMKKAAAIVAYRTENGPFQDVMELTKVSGIGDKTIENNRANLLVNSSVPETE